MKLEDTIVRNSKQKTENKVSGELWLQVTENSIPIGSSFLFSKLFYLSIIDSNWLLKEEGDILSEKSKSKSSFRNGWI